MTPDILHWPEHHAGLAWWIGIAISCPFWVIGTYRLIAQLPMWGAKWQLFQLGLQIEGIQTAHENTYGLVLYIAREILDYAVASCFSFGFVLVVCLFKPHAITLLNVVTTVSMSFIGVTLTVGLNLRRVVRALMSFETEVTALKDKQQRLRSRIKASTGGPSVPQIKG